MHAQKAEGAWSATGGTSRTTVVDGRTQYLPSSSTTRDTIRGEGITGCCSVYSSVLRVQRSLAEDWSDISDDGTHSSTSRTQGQAMNKTDIFLASKGRTRRRAPRDRCQSSATKEDEETQDNRAAYQRFFASVVDSTDKLDRLLASLDTPSRPGNAPSYSGRRSPTQDIYFSGEADNAVQFNTKEEATEWEELAKTLRQLDSGLASDAGVSDLRAVAFWCLAKRERLWSEDEKLTRAEQSSLRSIRAMQINHEEVDSVLISRTERIAENMLHMRREIGAKSKEWAEALLGVQDGVIRSSLHSRKRTRDIISATEERIAVLKAELAETDHHVVGLSKESEEFTKAKGMYTRKAEHLQHIVEQQRARLEQISEKLARTKEEAGSLDDSLQNIARLESAAEGGGKNAAASPEQSEGREQLQALVREEARRKNQEQAQAIARRAGLLEENKRLREETKKAESALSNSQTPEETRNSLLRLHQTEIESLKAKIKSASTKLAQTERQISQSASRNVRSAQSAQTKPPTNVVADEKRGDGSSDEGNQVDSQAWYRLEMLRAQHCVLVEDLQRSESAEVGKDDDPLRQASLLTAACWQLRDNGSCDAGNEQGTAAALELAAAVVATGLTSGSSDLSRRIMDALRWEGQAPPLEDKLIGIASRVRWMYLVRLAVELGVCDFNEWEEALHLLAEPKKTIDVESLYETRQGIHALFHGFRGGDGPLLLDGVFPRSTESRGELVSLIERGQARLAKLNVLLRALWSESAGTGRGSFEERTEILNTLVGVMVGESQLHPNFALKLFSALGLDVIRRAKSGPDKVPQSLQGDIANLGLSSGGALSGATQRAALAVTKLAALVRISEALSKSRDELSLDLAQRGEALQAELRVQVKAYAEHQQNQRREEVLSAAEDFIAEMPPEEAEHGPGNSQLDVMTHLLEAIITGRREHLDNVFNPNATTTSLQEDMSAEFSTRSGKEAFAQGDVADAAMVGSNHSIEQALASPTDRRTPGPLKQDRHRLDARGNLPEIFAKIAGAMPCDPDQYVASAWRTMQARMERPRGDEEVELEAFELAVDAQALETLRESLLEAIDRPERNLCDLPVSVNEGIEQPLSGGVRLMTGPLSGSEVTHDDETKALRRQAGAVRYKNAMNIVARTGLALPSPAEGGTPSLTAFVAAAKHARRWRSAAQDDGSGLGRPELERLNSIMDMRITNLSDQLATLVRSKNVKPGTAKQTKADHAVVLSPDDWAKSERQQLNARIRIRKEKLHGMETRLRDIRKGGKGRTGDVEAIWMSEDARLEMETNLLLISRKIAKANFLLRKMRSRWDIFRERHRHLAPLVHDRLTQSDTFKNGAPGARVITETPPRERSQRPSPTTSSFVVDAQAGGSRVSD